MAAPPRNFARQPTDPHGTLRNGKMAELRLETGNLGNTGLAFCLPIVVARLYGGLVYLAFPRWALVRNVHPRGMPPPGTPTERR